MNFCTIKPSNWINEHCHFTRTRSENAGKLCLDSCRGIYQTLVHGLQIYLYAFPTFPFRENIQKNNTTTKTSLHFTHLNDLFLSWCKSWTRRRSNNLFFLSWFLLPPKKSTIFSLGWSIFFKVSSIYSACQLETWKNKGQHKFYFTLYIYNY